MIKKLKSIETCYNGFRFRSRAEARWAIFFDEMGIKYEYEPEGFVFSDGTKYLPDFYLPDANEWFEVKGVMDELDAHKIEMLLNESGKAVAIGYSDMSFVASDDFDGWVFDSDKEDSWLCRCGKCNKVYFLGSHGAWGCPACKYYDGDSGFEVLLHGDHRQSHWSIFKDQKAVAAVQKAQRARFEYGEGMANQYGNKEFGN